MRGIVHTLGSVKHITQTIERASSANRLAYNTTQTCEALGGISSVSLWRLVKRGLLRPSRALRHPLYPIAEIERFLRETSEVAK